MCALVRSALPGPESRQGENATQRGATKAETYDQQRNENALRPYALGETCRRPSKLPTTLLRRMLNKASKRARPNPAEPRYY
ncbi:hypothetical protein BC629DRAFT_1522660, partial [Irpex lacteus]